MLRSTRKLHHHSTAAEGWDSALVSSAEAEEAQQVSAEDAYSLLPAGLFPATASLQTSAFKRWGPPDGYGVRGDSSGDLQGGRLQGCSERACQRTWSTGTSLLLCTLHLADQEGNIPRHARSACKESFRAASQCRSLRDRPSMNNTCP